MWLSISLCLAGVALFILFCWAGTRRGTQACEAKHPLVPPISDDEFLARCPPGTNRAIALKVRRIVADQLGVDYERIRPESRFVEDLGAD